MLLNTEQSLAIENTEGTTLVLAGAGTGKTALIIGFITKLLEITTIDRIWCVTFSNRAANELINRIKPLVNQNINLYYKSIGTFHSLCLNLLLKYNLINKETSIIDELDQKKILNKLGVIGHIYDIQKHKEGLKVLQSLDFRNALNIYNNFLEQNNMIDFSDILIKTIELFDNPIILDEVTNSIDYIIVDEYQDTNSIQYRILYLLRKNNPNLFCVGDPDQLIYSWRGADIHNIRNLLRDFPQCKRYFLTINYRSTDHIINIANTIRLENMKLQTAKIGSKVIVCNSKNESEYIIKCLINKKPNKKHAILVRASSLVPPVEECLIKNNINYKIYGKNRFYDRLEIKVAIDYLKFIFNHDVVSLERFVSYPRRGIGPKKINHLIENFKINTIEESFIENGLSELWYQIKNWHNLLGTPSYVADKIFREAGLYDYFTERYESFKQLLENINMFNNIQDFLLNFFTIDTEEEADIVISTIHASKGLEFDVVYVIGLLDGIFPNFQAIQENNIAEEKRLFYVAVTRAKQQLHLVYSLLNNKKYWGISRFLFNLPKESFNYQIHSN